MFHKSIAPPTGTWRRIRAALLLQPQMSRPAAQDRRIHPAWCTCNDCSLERRRRFTRADAMIIGLALLCAGIAGIAASFIGGR